MKYVEENRKIWDKRSEELNITIKCMNKHLLKEQK